MVFEFDIEASLELDFFEVFAIEFLVEEGQVEE